MASQTMVARRSFTYGGTTCAPVDLDFGQLVELSGERTDDRLIEYRHVVPAPRGASVVQCGKCGARFMTDAHLNMHGKKRHPDHKLTDIEQLEAMEREDRMVTTQAPLNMGGTVEVNTTPAVEPMKKRRGRPPKAKTAAN